MALEPVMPTDAQDDSEIRRVRNRFWFSVAFAVPVTLIAMVPHFLRLHTSETGAYTLRALELLLSPVVLWAAADYYRRGWLGCRQSHPKHVHAHRTGRDRRIRLQPGSNLRARLFSGGNAR